MSKFYYDTEFIEGKQDKKILGFKYGETKPTIDLISIGIVSQSDRTYSAVSKDFNLKEAWNRTQGEGEYWIRENVLKPLFDELAETGTEFNFKNFKAEVLKYGKTNETIRREITTFIYTEGPYKTFEEDKYGHTPPTIYPKVELIGWYSAYDHVVLCQLFGTMMDLPKGFPMFTTDLKQRLDRIHHIRSKRKSKTVSLKSWLKLITMNPLYPVNDKVHTALSDAKWTRDMDRFINKHL